MKKNLSDGEVFRFLSGKAESVIREVVTETCGEFVSLPFAYTIKRDLCAVASRQKDVGGWFFSDAPVVVISGSLATFAGRSPDAVFGRTVLGALRENICA